VQSNIAQKFIAHLDLITGRDETVIRKIDSTHEGLPSVHVFIYKEWPEQDLITGFTFGLSSAKHYNWKFGRPELMISVESKDEAWPLSVGFMAERLRGNCPFCYGNTINFKEKISQESELDAFLIFGPPFLKKELQSVNLEEFTCNITGMYPIFSQEIELYNDIGLEKFWHMDEWNPFNPKRKPIKKIAQVCTGSVIDRRAH
jgi:hypothetical protein